MPVLVSKTGKVIEGRIIQNGLSNQGLTRADTGEYASVTEPVGRAVQEELVVVGVAVQIHDAAIAVRVLPRIVRKAICATAS